MKKILHGLEPAEVFFWFEEVARIPRESGHEKEISDYLVKFAVERGLPVYQDEYCNVIIEKAATPGYEKAKKVLLQGHMDMVCVKEENVVHDFEKDPIRLKVHGDYIQAEGTSLGADDGNALALCLALLDSSKVRHPALQVLFTTQEETTLAGASHVDPHLLDASYYIGLDFSKDQKLLVSCAGSSIHYLELPIRRNPSKMSGVIEIKLSGCTGGHSGNAIDQNRANANIVLAEILRQTFQIKKYELIEFSGGMQDNVICQSAEAKILTEAADAEALCRKIEERFQTERAYYLATDPHMTLHLNKSSGVHRAMTEEDTEKILSLITEIPNGLYACETVPKITPVASSNLGIVRTKEQSLLLDTLVRSNQETLHEEISGLLQQTAEAFGAAHRVESRTPAWENDKKSSLIQRVKQVYREKFHADIDTISIHAQVEIGVILERMKQAGRYAEAVGLGVLTYDVHTTKERVSIPSLKRTYELLCSILESLD